MPKISKEKFTKIGGHKGRTTFSGDIELILYYDVQYSRFHFDYEEIKKYFPDLDRAALSFQGCDTRQKAITLFKNFINESLVGTRMLGIKLHFDDQIISRFKNSKAISGTIACSSIGYGSNASGFAVSFERIMRYGTNGDYSYCECSKNWHPNLTNYYSLGDNLIEWDEGTEMFLINMQKQLDAMCEKIISFFTTGTIDELKDKMKQYPLMLDHPKP